MGSLRWRRHRKLLGLIILAFLILVVVFGDVRIAAITSSERSAADAEVTNDIAGLVDLFDDGVVHEIGLTFAQQEYDAIIAAYQDEGEKDYIEASVIIDGTTISSVGLRLKGNSTLMGLREDGPFGGEGAEGRERMMPPSECVPPEVAKMFEEQMRQDAATPGAGATPGATPAATPEGGTGGFGGGPGGNPFSETLSADDPTSLPWLISFDEFVDGQRYQGLSDIAIRPEFASETNLNEALALSLIGAAGEPTQGAAYSSVAMNGSEAALKLILEVPGDDFAEQNFFSDGVLYKSLSTGGFDYLGDDPTLYETAFDQETGKNHQDLKPLIDLMQWTSEATDQEFAAELEDHVDIESLARYIALQELLDNFDDMAGPGKNYYFWYDLETEKFKVISWDLNLALSSFGGPGGGRGSLGGEMGGLGSFDLDAMFSCIERVRGEEGGGGDGPGSGMRMGHPIKDRFLAAPEFRETYTREYAAVYDALFADDVAVRELTRLASVIEASGLVDMATSEHERGQIASKLKTQAALGPTPPDNSTTANDDAATPIGATPGAASPTP